MDTTQYPQSIALVGLSGTGKSTVGRMLATRLGWPLQDIDARVVAEAGCSIAQIFADHGEAQFRALETAALAATLGAAPCVIATGAGIVLASENRVLLRERCFVVWLDAPTEALVARLRAHDEERPLLIQGMAARLDALRAARAALYAEVADVRVETAGRSADAICDDVQQFFTREYLFPS